METKELQLVLDELKDLRKKCDIDFLRIKEEILYLIISQKEILEEIQEIRTLITK